MSTLLGSITVTSVMTQATAATIPGGQPLANQTQSRFAIASPAGAAGSADNADLKYSAILPLAATPTVLDLTALKDVLGNPISFARVRSILISNPATVDGQVVKLGYAAATANAWTGLISNPGQLTIEPSSALNPGVLALTAPNTTGLPVTSTSKLLNLDPGAATIALSIEIVGCSA